MSRVNSVFFSIQILLLQFFGANQQKFLVLAILLDMCPDLGFSSPWNITPSSTLMNYSLHGFSASMNLIMAFCEMKSALTERSYRGAEHKSIPLMSFNGKFSFCSMFSLFFSKISKVAGGKVCICR